MALASSNTSSAQVGCDNEDNEDEEAAAAAAAGLQAASANSSAGQSPSSSCAKNIAQLAGRANDAAPAPNEAQARPLFVAGESRARELEEEEGEEEEGLNQWTRQKEAAADADVKKGNNSPGARCDQAGEVAPLAWAHSYSATSHSEPPVRLERPIQVHRSTSGAQVGGHQEQERARDDQDQDQDHEQEQEPGQANELECELDDEFESDEGKCKFEQRNQVLSGARRSSEQHVDCKSEESESEESERELPRSEADDKEEEEECEPNEPSAMGKRLGRPSGGGEQLPPPSPQLQEQATTTISTPQLAQQKRPKRARTPLGTSSGMADDGGPEATATQQLKANQAASKPSGGTRSASAMAGSLQPASSANLQPSPTAGASRPPSRTRTTRVRINSTSEQIQDPNWLIQMSREFELQQHQPPKRAFALRSLHQKLKSIGGGSSSKATLASAAALEQQQQCKSAANPNNDNQQASQSATVPPPVPTTPQKVPVSILKHPQQPNSGAGQHRALARSSQHHHHHQQPSNTQAVDYSLSNPTISTRPNSRANNKRDSDTSRAAQSTSASRNGQLAASPSSTASNNAKGQAQAKAGETHKQPEVGQARTPPRHNQAPPQLNLAPPGAATGPGASQPQLPQVSQVALPTSPTRTSGHHQRPVPICADGQVKVSGWKRNNLLAKTLSHFDEIRGNQRPIFVPTKIKLQPDSALSTATQRGGSSPGSSSPTTHQQQQQQQVQFSDLLAAATKNQSPTAATMTQSGGNKFADIVREAILKKGLLSSSSSSVTAGSQAALVGAVLATKRASGDSPGVAAATADHQLSSRLCSLDTATGSNTQISGSSPAKRPVSADPGPALLTSLSGGCGGGGGGTGSSGTSQSTKSRKTPLLFDSNSNSNPNSTGQSQAGSHLRATHSQQASPTSQVAAQQQQQYPSVRLACSSSPSMAQIIAAAVAASQSSGSELLAGQQRSSFSLAGTSSSSRAFKLQLKNEQLLQQLRRQSNEHHHHLLATSQSPSQDGQSSPSNGGDAMAPEGCGSGGGGGGGAGSGHRGSVRLKDWKRLTNKLGLLTGRASERQAFAGAVRSAAGTPTQPHPSASGQLLPLRLTVSNQESRGHRRSHRGSQTPDTSAGSTQCQAAPQSSGGRLLVPGVGGGGNLFDSNSRRHSSQIVTDQSLGVNSERKLSSSSMVVQSVSISSNANKLSLGSHLKTVESPAALSSGGRQRVSRSAAASPMLSAHQDSICLRRSSDSEACGTGHASGGTIRTTRIIVGGGGGGGGAAGSSLTTRDVANLQVADKEEASTVCLVQLAGGSRSSQFNVSHLAGSGHGSNSSSVSGASSTQPQDRSEVAGPSSGASKHRDQETKGSTPVVVNRNDLIQLLQVTGTGISLNVQQPTDSESCLCGTSSCSCRDGTQEKSERELNKADCPELSAALADDLASTTTKVGDDSNLMAAKEESQEQEADAKPSQTPKKNDLIWVVKRTSKVAFFQQKLRKMRWHSKQQQREKQQEQERQGLQDGATNDQNANKDTSMMNDENEPPKKQEEAGGERPKNTNFSQGKPALASDVFMDPTLIGDAIEIFLRTTMQQQHQDEGEGEGEGEEEGPQEDDHEQEHDQDQGDEQPSKSSHVLDQVQEPPPPPPLTSSKMNAVALTSSGPINEPGKQRQQERTHIESSS